MTGSGDIVSGNAANGNVVITSRTVGRTLTETATACPTAMTATAMATACPTATTVAPTTRIAAEPEQDGRAERASNHMVTAPKTGEAKADQRVVVESARLRRAVVP